MKLGRGSLALRFGLLAVLAACSAASACSGRVQASTENDIDADHGTESVEVATPSPGILRAMLTAPFETQYGGTRKIEYFFDIDGQVQNLAYREEVLADGSGAFEVNATEVLSAHPQPDLFLMLQRVRQGFVYRMRDFQLRDLRLFRSNYSVEVIGNAPVAGVDCVVLRVERLVLPDGDHLVHVDPETGLVLRWEDRTAGGSVRGRMQFESYTRTPDLTGAVLSEGRYDSRRINLSLSDASEVGFELLRPSLPPSGYRLEESSVLVDDLGDKWVRSYYTDGVQRVAFMHRGAPVSPMPGPGPGFEGAIPSGEGVVRESHLGPWTIVTGRVGDQHVILMGRVPADELYQMLQSAL